jgi:cephalosporin hydroxylase
MITIDEEKGQIISMDKTYGIGTPEAFSLISKVWLRSAWDNKYIYSFTWMGRPIIQLPEDMFRIQEVIYKIKPDVIIETGVAHGGSSVFYAGLCKAMGTGRVISVDVEIRPHNRLAIESHEMFSHITLVEGSSIDPKIVQQVRYLIKPKESCLVILDSCHTKDHVRKELEAYSDIVSVGSYIFVQDGWKEWLVGAPRTESDWDWNNPKKALEEFTAAHDNFAIEEPAFLFNEGQITERVTACPKAFLKRIK